MKKRLLSIDEYVEKMKNDSKQTDVSDKSDMPHSKHIEEETKPNLPALEAGDFVEDKYGNRYEVIEVTKDFKVADEYDDWEQIAKYKDDKDVTFVVVWAKTDKEKKFVFVYGVEDDYAVRKVDSPELEGDDKISKIFKLACDKIEDDTELQKFKHKWRKFMDMIRAGKIPNEKYIMMEILDDFNMSDIVTGLNKPKVQESVYEGIKPSLGESLPDGIYDVIYKNETYFVKPTVGDTKLFAYTDEHMENIAKLDGKTLMFTIKDLFGVDKWQKEWTASVGGDTE